MSRNKYTPPVITVEGSPNAGFWLMATSHAHTARAGVRLLRAEPWPEIQWSQPTKELAEAEAVKLRTYLEECASGKRQDKESVPTRRGWWQD